MGVRPGLERVYLSRARHMAQLKSSLPPPICPNYVESSYSSLNETCTHGMVWFAIQEQRIALRIEVQGPLPSAEAKSSPEVKPSQDLK